MKYVKQFENINQVFWLIEEIFFETGDSYYKLFPDKESAENFVIYIINDQRKEIEDNYTDDMYFTDIDEANDWYSSIFPEVRLSYHSIQLSKPFKATDKLQRLRDTKKYNL